MTQVSQSRFLAVKPDDSLRLRKPEVERKIAGDDQRLTYTDLEKATAEFPFGTKFNPNTGEAIPKFNPETGRQNW